MADALSDGAIAEVNTRVQESASRRACEAVLLTCSGPMLRAVADLNHLDTDGTTRTVLRRIVDERHGAYRPGHAYVGAVTPQSEPDLFTDDDIKAEIKYLLGLNKRYGSHVLRTVAYTKLMTILVDRKTSGE